MKKLFFILFTVLMIFSLSSCSENCAGSSHAEEIATMIDTYVGSSAVVSGGSIPVANPATTSPSSATMRQLTSGTSSVFISMSTNTDSSYVSPTDNDSRPYQISIVYKDSTNSSLVYNFIDLNRYYSTPTDPTVNETHSNYILDDKTVNILVPDSDTFKDIINALKGDLINSLPTSEIVSLHNPTQGKNTDALQIVETTIMKALSDQSAKDKLTQELSVTAPQNTQKAISNTAYIFLQLSKGSKFTIIPAFRKAGKNETRVNACEEAFDDCVKFFSDMKSRADSNTATKKDILALELAQTYVDQYANIFVEMLQTTSVTMDSTCAQTLSKKVQIYDLISNEKLATYIPSILNIVQN